jgi:glycosyltransferase involved in cell wall biosynthesis
LLRFPAKFPGKLALQQRVLPAYRAPFFDALAQACTGGLSVFAGQPRPDENIPSPQGLQIAQLVPARNWHFFSVQSPFYRCYQPGIVHWLESWQPDALIVEANPRYLSTPSSIRWMHIRNKPVIGWGLGAPPVSGRLAGWRMRSRTKFLGTLDATIAYSQRGADEYRQMGFPAGRVFVAPNAVSGRPANPLPPRPLEFEGQPRLLFVGRLQERKRIDNLLQACAALPEALQPELRIVGDGPVRVNFECLAQQVYPRTQFTGAHYGAELEADFTWADLFVLPGTGGLAVQQAMAYGLPVIVAQGDGTQDDLVRSENGWQVLPDDLAALQAALGTALVDAPRLRQMGAESYRIVRDEINLERMVAVFVEALKSVTSFESHQRG